MHSLLIVIGDGNLAEMMEPFWQDLEVEEYLVGEVNESEKEDILRYYAGRGEKFSSFEECYRVHGEDWNGNRYRKDDDGVWREYSASNPDMKWDWYEVGGRFAGRLVLLPGVEPIQPVHFSWGWEPEARLKVVTAVPRRADTAYLKDIANADELTAISVLKDGEWIDVDEDGFDGKSVKPYLEGLPGDTLITVVDYHM